MNGENEEESQVATEENAEVSERRAGKWSEEEHLRYLEAMQLYEEQKKVVTEKWNFIQEIIKTRTVQQCRSHHQKHELKLKRLESKRQEQQHLECANEQSQVKPLPQGHQMPPHYQRPPFHQPMYIVPASHQQEQMMMRTYQDAPYWPPPPPQYYSYNQPPQMPYQQPQYSYIPRSMPPSDHSSPPPWTGHGYR